MTAPNQNATVLRYQAATEALAAQTQSQALAVWTAYQSGRLARDQAVSLIAAVVNFSNASAVSLADAGISVQIEQAAGIPAPATGITPADATDRLLKAVDTILEEGQTAAIESEADVIDVPAAADEPASDVPAEADSLQPPPDTQMRIERLARSEPLEAAQSATIEAMQRQPLVEGWTRQMDADPCQLCRWWWREGRIWPKEHPFQSHKGCNCTPKVVLAEHIESTVYTRRLKRNEQSRTTD